jgi:Arc/MetJ family transcription regulator
MTLARDRQADDRLGEGEEPTPLGLDARSYGHMARLVGVCAALRGSGGGLGKRSSLAVYSYFRYDTPVAVSKVSLSIDEDVLAEARERAGRRELSSFVNEALRRQLQRDRLAELLAEMDAESGPVPDDVMEEARKLWRSAPTGKRRRSA